MPRTEMPTKVLSGEEVERYRREGFLLLDRPVIPADALKEVRDQIDNLFDHFQRLAPRYARDLAPGARAGEPPRIPEIDVPSKFAPKLMESPVLNICTRIARELHGPDVELTWDHAIYKPPLNEAATPWHQDAAYAEPGQDSVGMWVPLQDVSADQACMRFVPGSHRLGLATHAHLASESNPGLLGAQVDETAVVNCPVSAGGLVLHNDMTLHSTGPNLGTETRRVWILNVGIRRPTARAKLYDLRVAATRPWLTRA